MLQELVSSSTVAESEVSDLPRLKTFNRPYSWWLNNFSFHEELFLES
jgi:hypothetical protein